jgi:hypothetical protein
MRLQAQHDQYKAWVTQVEAERNALAQCLLEVLPLIPHQFTGPRSKINALLANLDIPKET